MAKISVIGICGRSVFMPVDHFHAPGETVVAKELAYELGGKGFNQAIAAARMGAEVSFLAAMGDDEITDECEAVLKGDGIKSYVIRKHGQKSAIAFILTDKDGENRVTEYEDAKLSVEDILTYEKEISESEFLMIQNEVPEEVNDKALEIAHKYGVKVIYNPAPARKSTSTKNFKYYVGTPNEHERAFCDEGRFDNYIITLGKNGCLVNGKTEIPAIDVKPVDTTGAGDTFNGYLAACLLEGMEIELAAKYAVAASGLSVSKKYVVGAIPYREEVEKILNI